MPWRGVCYKIDLKDQVHQTHRCLSVFSMGWVSRQLQPSFLKNSFVIFPESSHRPESSSFRWKSARLKLESWKFSWRRSVRFFGVFVCSMREKNTFRWYVLKIVCLKRISTWIQHDFDEKICPKKIALSCVDGMMGWYKLINVTFTWLNMVDLRSLRLIYDSCSVR